MNSEIANQLISSAVILIPAHNEGNQIASTVLELKKYFKNIVVVDDGSTDNTFENVLKLGVLSVKHPINLGQGASIQTAITVALSSYPECEFFITFDADGQHSVDSAIEMLNLIQSQNCDVVLGSRFIHKESNGQMPQKKKFILKLGILFTRLDTGLKVTDTHNGLRVMNKRFAKSLNLKQNGMAHASEILAHIKSSKATWIEAPAEIFYTDYSKKKGQSVLNAVNILTEMMHR